VTKRSLDDALADLATAKKLLAHMREHGPSPATLRSQGLQIENAKFRAMSAYAHEQGRACHRTEMALAWGSTFVERATS